MFTQYSNDIKQVVNTAMQLLHKSPTASAQEMVHRVSCQLYRLYVTVKEFSGKLSSVKLRLAGNIRSLKELSYVWMMSLHKI